MNHRHDVLPNSATQRFLTDSGLETTLVFLEGRELPCFASFPLLETSEGRERIERYYREHTALAIRHGTGFLFESVTWRANPDWGAKLGYTRDRLAEINRSAIELVRPISEELAAMGVPSLVSGNIGPRGDGYDPSKRMTSLEARDYHDWQIAILAETPIDFVSAFTINHSEEAEGIVEAARRRAVPVSISFTLETDGRLPTGQPLRDAIEQVDAATHGHASHYMINCAHPDHFDAMLTGDAEWMKRIRGIRANASRRSHAELDQSTELDAGDPEEFGEQYRALAKKLPNLSIFGGCCGTDCRHVEAIARRCSPVTGNA